MRLVGKAKRTEWVSASNAEGGRNIRNVFESAWDAPAAAWDVLPEDVRGAPVPCWEYGGKVVRIGTQSYLKNIGDGLSIRVSTGEVFREVDDVEALYAQEA